MRKLNKQEKIIMVCTEIECAIEDGHLKIAEGKIIELVGELAKNTRYEKDVDSAMNSYFDLKDFRMANR